MKIKSTFATEDEAIAYLIMRGWMRDKNSLTGKLINPAFPKHFRFTYRFGSKWKLGTGTL